MNAKLPSVTGPPAPKRPCDPLRASSPAVRQTILLILALVVVVHSVWKIPILGKSQNQPLATKRVPLEAHIVAKCPNARTALSELVLPTIERVHDKVDFKLSMLGKLPENGDIECKHGFDECQGSIIELCAQDLYSDTRMSLGFIECVTAEYERIPERALYEACASMHSVDIKEIYHCASRNEGAYGRRLLRDSIRHSLDVNARLNGTVRVISGTVRLNEEIYCIRDGDHWTDCPNGAGVVDLIDAIERLYNATTAYVDGVVGLKDLLANESLLGTYDVNSATLQFFWA